MAGRPRHGDNVPPAQVPTATCCPSLLQTFYLELYVPTQIKVLGILADVVLDPGIVHIVGVVIREGEVRVTHHLFAGVGEDGAVDAGSAFLCLVLEGEECGRVPLQGLGAGGMTPACPGALHQQIQIPLPPGLHLQAGAREKWQSHQVQ